MNPTTSCSITRPICRTQPGISVREPTASFMTRAVECVVARLDVGPKYVRAAAAILSEEEQQRARRFAIDLDRFRFVVARAKLRDLLGERLGIRPEAVQLTYGKRGKPALRGETYPGDIRFNTSHCRDIAVYAFTTGREIGIDIEAVRHLADADDIAMRCFSIREYRSYCSLGHQERPRAFFNCWTRKEAFIKAIGDGFHYPLDEFDVTLAPHESTRILRVGNVSGNKCGWRLCDFVPLSGYVGAVVLESPLRDVIPVKKHFESR